MEEDSPIGKEEIAQLLREILKLNPSEIEVFLRLMGSRKTARELAIEMGKNRSTIQRTLQNLLARDLVSRRTTSREDGGYEYIYQAISAHELGKILSRRLEEMQARYSALIRKLLEGRISID